MSDSPEAQVQRLLAPVRIVLIGTTHPGNIGATARAMKTMGLGNLWLVAPQRFPHPDAHGRAKGGRDLLDNATVVETLEEAIGDCRYVVGTSARDRRIPWPVQPPRQVAGDMVTGGASGPVALLFGREDRGLTNEELQRCNVHVRIPANPGYSSLNLGSAVQLLAYELRLAAMQHTEGELPAWDRVPATAAQMEGFYQHLESAITAVGFHDPSNPGQVMTRMRRLFNRVQLDETEVQVLRGIFTAMDGMGHRKD